MMRKVESSALVDVRLIDAERVGAPWPIEALL